MKAKKVAAKKVTAKRVTAKKVAAKKVTAKKKVSRPASGQGVPSKQAVPRAKAKAPRAPRAQAGVAKGVKLAAKRAKARVRGRGQAPVAGKNLLEERIHALLHTMHQISIHEDQLCTLLHAAKAGQDDVAGELEELLDTMPSHEYGEDLERLRQSIPAAH